MNIIVICDYLYPDVVCGAYNYAHDIAQRLAARGHRCWGIGGHPGDDRPYHERIGAVDYYRYPVRRGNHVLSFTSRVIGALWAAQQISHRHRIDVVNSHGPMGSVGACLAPRARAIPRLATAHGTGIVDEYFCEKVPLRGEVRSLGRRLEERLYCAAMDRVERWYLRRATWMHTPSRFGRDAFVEHHHLAPSRVTVIPPGVDLERFRPGPRDAARDRLGLPVDRPILFTVRRLSARMGLDRLIHAARRVAAERPEVLVLIGGQGPMRQRLEQLIAELGVETNVRLLGLVPAELLPVYYQAADLFVLPTIASEGFGLVSLEALACDLPVLGTPVGATVELLSAFDPEMLFADTTPEAMAAQILTWLRRGGERAGYRTRVVERFSWEACMDRMERLLTAVAGGEAPTKWGEVDVSLARG
jgi:glycosyltransferase involved in cell wall biosynthesis